MEEQGNGSRMVLSLTVRGAVVLLVSMPFVLLAMPVAAQPVNVWVNAPEEYSADSFIATIGVNEVTNFNAAQFDLTFNKSVLKVSDVTEGEIDGVDVPSLMWALNPNNEDTVRILLFMPIGEYVSGSGYLAKITFSVVGAEGEESVLNLSNGELVCVKFSDSFVIPEEIPVAWIDANVRITSPPVHNTVRNIHTGENFASIQDAIDDPDTKDGHTITIAGTYHEHVVVNKRLTLRGTGLPEIRAGGDGSAIRVVHEGCVIDGFSVRWGDAGIRVESDSNRIRNNNASNNLQGIHLLSAANNTLTNNTVRKNNKGFYLHDSDNNIITQSNASNNYGDGICLDSSCNNTVLNNAARTKNNYGIHLKSSNQNVITNNNASGNYWKGISLDCSQNNTVVDNNANSNDNYGFWLYSSSTNTFANNRVNANSNYGFCLNTSTKNTLVNNTMAGNKKNFGVFGCTVSHFSQNIDHSNLVDGRPIYYWVGQQNQPVPGDAGFAALVNCTNITVSDLTLRNNSAGVLFANTTNSMVENVTTRNNRYGIHLRNSSSNTLSNNTASSNGDGIQLVSSISNTVSNNTASSNECGICLTSSRTNAVTNNTANVNRENGILLVSSSDDNTLIRNMALQNRYGVRLSYSSNNSLADNILSENTYNVGIDGRDLSHFYQYIDRNNRVDGKPLYYLVDQKDQWIRGDAGFVALVNCTDITVSDLTLRNNSAGVLFACTNNSRVENVTALNNRYGIHLYYSTNNRIYQSTFINNTHNTRSYRSTTIWNSAEKIIYTYNGMMRTNYMGNYWCDYTGSDADNDGIGDTPYSINGENRDIYPLMQPFVHYFIKNPIRVPDNYPTIQQAVDNATDGDVIIVRDGTYIENVKVNKRVTIQSEHGADLTFVYAADPNEDVCEVRADNVHLSGFTLAGAAKQAGIYLNGVDYCRISNNNASNNNIGLRVEDSKHNALINNRVTMNDRHGIYLASSERNEMSNNSAVYNGDDGILLSHSKHNRITNNSARLNRRGYGVHVYYSDNNSAKSNDVQGIGFSYSSNNLLVENHIDAGTICSFGLYHSSTNKIVKNTISGGFGTCIFTNASKNIIYLNNFMDRFLSVESSASTNTWNSTSKVTYTYNGNTYTNYLGNYWRDYNGTDIDKDGLGDTPYRIDSDKDDYPLMARFENYFVSKPIHVPDDYPTIQRAVDNATDGDVIIVRDGTYRENVKVNKRLMIRSENGSESTMVIAEDLYEDVFEVTADYTYIIGFTAKEGSAGIRLKARYCNIFNSTCVDNWCGILIHSSKNNSVFSNDCSDNGAGIYLYSSNNSNIFNNTCSNNYYGIHIGYSNNSKLTGNVMVKNGIFIWGDSLCHYVHEIDESNTANGKPVYYWKDVEGVKIPDGAGQVLLVRCKNVTVEEQKLKSASVGVTLAFSSSICITNNNYSSNSYGVQVHQTNNSKISDNDFSNSSRGLLISYSNNTTISDNDCSNTTMGIYLYSSNNSRIINNDFSNNLAGGIYFWYSHNNSVSSNNCSSSKYGNGFYLAYSNNNRISRNNCLGNREEAIALLSSDNNIIYLNNFVNNSDKDKVYSYHSTTIWNSTEKIKYTHNGEAYTNYLGNYWDDYAGSDADNDGIGDTAYRIDSENDRYPLMARFEMYFAPVETIFDTGTPEEPYPSIYGTHNGTITPSQSVNVSTLYTYPCSGTGGHAEYVRIWNESGLTAEAHWDGYEEDWHNLTFPKSFILEADKTYNYTIRTGSYPQIYHNTTLTVPDGIITCTRFTDANGQVYYDGIPAIKLFL